MKNVKCGEEALRLPYCVSLVIKFQFQWHKKRSVQLTNGSSSSWYLCCYLLLLMAQQMLQDSLDCLEHQFQHPVKLKEGYYYYYNAYFYCYCCCVNSVRMWCR